MGEPRNMDSDSTLDSFMIVFNYLLFVIKGKTNYTICLLITLLVWMEEYVAGCLYELLDRFTELCANWANSHYLFMHLLIIRLNGIIRSYYSINDNQKQNIH